MLSHTHVSNFCYLYHKLVRFICLVFYFHLNFHYQEYSKEAVAHVQKYLMKNEVPVNLFEPYIEEIFNHLRGDPFRNFLER
jgi:hypothetical protein